MSYAPMGRRERTLNAWVDRRSQLKNVTYRVILAAWHCERKTLVRHIKDLVWLPGEGRAEQVRHSRVAVILKWCTHVLVQLSKAVERSPPRKRSLCPVWVVQWHQTLLCSWWGPDGCWGLCGNQVDWTTLYLSILLQIQNYSTNMVFLNSEVGSPQIKLSKDHTTS